MAYVRPPYADVYLGDSALNCARDEAIPSPPVKLGRYLCPDPWCAHAAHPHSHGRPDA